MQELPQDQSTHVMKSITLSKLHRVLDRIKTEKDAAYAAVGSYMDYQSIKAIPGVGGTVEDNTDRIEAELEKYYNLSNAYFSIKAQINQANGPLGITAMLGRIDYLDSVIALNKQMRARMTPFGLSNKLNKEEVTNALENLNTRFEEADDIGSFAAGVNISYLPFDETKLNKENIDATVKVLRKQKEEIQDKVAELNLNVVSIKIGKDIIKEFSL